MVEQRFVSSYILKWGFLNGSIRPPKLAFEHGNTHPNSLFISQNHLIQIRVSFIANVRSTVFKYNNQAIYRRGTRKKTI